MPIWKLAAPTTVNGLIENGSLVYFLRVGVLALASLLWRAPNSAAAQTVHNVRAYGAIGDGISDDTGAVQSAINTGNAYFPAGTYLLTKPLIVPRSARIIGDGKNSTLRWRSAAVGIIAAKAAALSIHNLQVLGQTGRLLDISNSANVHIDHVWFSGGGTGVGHAPMAALSLSQSSDIWITGSDFTNDVGYDIVVNFSSSGPSDRLHIEHNHIHGSHARISIALFDTSHSEVEGNVIDENNQTAGTDNDGYGILIYWKGATLEPPVDNIVSRNVVRNTAGSGIYIQGSSNTVVSHNRVIDSVKEQSGTSLPAAAIAVNSGSAVGRFAVDVSILDNIIDTSGRSGIEISSTKHAIIRGNVIRHTARMAIRIRTKDPQAVVVENKVY